MTRPIDVAWDVSAIAIGDASRGDASTSARPAWPWAPWSAPRIGTVKTFDDGFRAGPRLARGPCTLRRVRCAARAGPAVRHRLLSFASSRKSARLARVMGEVAVSATMVVRLARPRVATTLELRRPRRTALRPRRPLRRRRTEASTAARPSGPADVTSSSTERLQARLEGLSHLGADTGPPRPHWSAFTRVVCAARASFVRRWRDRP